MIPAVPPPIRIEGVLSQVSGLRVGAVLTATVRGTPESPFLSLAATRVPLPAGASLLPGQQVRVEILPGEARQGIQVTPLSTTPLSLPKVPGLDDLLAPVLARFAGSAHAATARLVPPALPLAPQQLHQLLALFFEQSHAAEDLQRVAAMLQAVAEQMPDLAATAQFFAARAGMLAPQTAKEWRALLTQSAGDHGLEARIAAAIAEGRIADIPETLRDNLRAQLALLRGNQALAARLRESGQHEEFSEALGRLTERLGGGELQKLRAFGQAYHFIELPAAPDSGFTRGQIHFFADATGPEAPAGANRLVLDLELTRLGPLWIVLDATATHCTCRFQSSDSEVCAAIESVRDEIAAGLQAAGYRHAHVSACSWDGDRIAGVAALMDGLPGIRLEA